jgi:hypothetical protein
MLAQWLVGEKEETQGASSVLVSGAGTDTSNGTYTLDGQENGRNKYVSGSNTITWDGASIWTLFDSFEDRITYVIQEDVQFPWLGTWIVDDADGPPPTATEIPTVNPIANYISLPERYLWAKIAVAAGAPKDETAYIGLPKQYAWKDIYNAVSGSSLGTIDWGEKQALGHIAAAYRGDTGNPVNLATYIDWPWRYQVASIITQLATTTTFNAVIVAGAGAVIVNGTHVFDGNVNGRPSYRGIFITSSVISWDGSRWFINENGDDYYESTSDVAEPWLATGWGATGFGGPPPPTFTPTNV